MTLWLRAWLPGCRRFTPVRCCCAWVRGPDSQADLARMGPQEIPPMQMVGERPRLKRSCAGFWSGCSCVTAALWKRAHDVLARSADAAIRRQRASIIVTQCRESIALRQRPVRFTIQAPAQHRFDPQTAF